LYFSNDLLGCKRARCGIATKIIDHDLGAVLGEPKSECAANP
jgi:hypothetical protein